MLRKIILTHINKYHAPQEKKKYYLVFNINYIKVLML